MNEYDNVLCDNVWFILLTSIHTEWALDILRGCDWWYFTGMQSSWCVKFMQLAKYFSQCIKWSVVLEISFETLFILFDMWMIRHSAFVIKVYSSKFSEIFMKHGPYPGQYNDLPTSLDQLQSFLRCHLNKSRFLVTMMPYLNFVLTTV